MSIYDKRDLIIEELAPFEDPLERFAYIIDRGKLHPKLDEKYRIDAFLIEGCLSQLWLFPQFKTGKCFYYTESDASITKGIAALLCDLYSNELPEVVLSLEPDFLADVGITQHLSPNRRNGLTSVRRRIKDYAELCLSNENAQLQ